MNKPILKISNLSHRYSVKWAVKDVNLEIANKGIYGLLGANGAGKSTIMNAACGVIRQTDGTIEICGIDTIADSVNSRTKIGFLPQKPPLQQELTVIEFLKLSAKLRMIPDAEIPKAIDDVVAICNLESMKNRLISNLSGGYQQRVGIAQAIIHKPEVVIFDEPTNGLDPNQILEIRGLVRDIAKDRTVLLSTHILSEVQAICEKIIMIDKGSVVFNGSIDDFNNYITPDTVMVSLLEMPSVSLLEALPEVISVESVSETHYRVRSGNTKAVVKAIVKASVENNWDLEEIYFENTSMDDVFAVLSNN